MVILDPTVDKVDAAKQVLQKLPELVTADGELVVWYVQEGLIAKAPPNVRQYSINRKLKTWREDLENKVKRDADLIGQTFVSLWNGFHNSSGRRLAKSCILTALSESARYTEKSAVQKPTDLLVVSDFLEACGDSQGVNLERGLLETRTLVAADSTIDLSRISHAGFLRVPSDHVTTRPQRLHLERLWAEAADRFGLTKDKWWFGEQVDQLVDSFRAVASPERSPKNAQMLTTRPPG